MYQYKTKIESPAFNTLRDFNIYIELLFEMETWLHSHKDWIWSHDGHGNFTFAHEEQLTLFLLKFA